MDIIYLLLWCMAIMQRVLYIVIPAIALYGIVRLFFTGNIYAAITAPFFGLGKVRSKQGF